MFSEVRTRFHEIVTMVKDYVTRLQRPTTSSEVVMRNLPRSRGFKGRSRKVGRKKRDIWVVVVLVVPRVGSGTGSPPGGFWWSPGVVLVVPGNPG